MAQLILISFLIFAVWLIKRDTASRQGISGALWIPTLWLGILASRPVSVWLGTGGGSDTLDGSPVDRTFYLLLIAAALVTLSKRAVDTGWLIKQNWSIVLFYTFLLISVLWANSPFSSFKRWFKESGNIVIALVILTEVNPLEAFRTVFTRCAYTLIPLSVILLRYFPDLGRRYNQYSGDIEAVGVTLQKNSLGTMILACGLIFLWDWIVRSQNPRTSTAKIDKYFPVVIAGCGIWLLTLCDSKTSIVSLALGSLIVLSLRLPLLRQRLNAFGTYFLVGTITFFLLDRYIGLVAAIVRSLGRDMTFTGRTEVWRELLNVGTDPVLGTGFLSFWDDTNFTSKLPYWVGASAHNGYLEIYLAGGIIGATALALMLVSVIFSINHSLHSGSEYAAVRFAILVMMLISNFTESNFACMTPLGFLFIIGAIGRGRPASDIYLQSQPPDASRRSFDIGTHTVRTRTPN